MGGERKKKSERKKKDMPVFIDCVHKKIGKIVKAILYTDVNRCYRKYTYSHASVYIQCITHIDTLLCT